jgi:hypothetical protein
MNAIHDGLHWAARRIVAVLSVLVLVALLAGGVGGYLFRGASTLMPQQQSLAGPATRSQGVALPVNPGPGLSLQKRHRGIGESTAQGLSLQKRHRGIGDPTIQADTTNLAPTH